MRTTTRNTLPLCACGCGRKVKKIQHKFIYTHNLRGKFNYNWKGGEYYEGNYVYVNIGLNKYKLRSHIVMEQFLGRELLPGEIVHHKNEITDDDVIENLELCSTVGDHLKIHHTGKIVSEATRLKLSNTSKGYKHTEEAKKKMSEAHKGVKRPMKEETKLKLSEKHKGEILSEKHKLALKTAWLLRKERLYAK